MAPAAGALAALMLGALALAEEDGAGSCSHRGMGPCGEEERDDEATTLLQKASLDRAGSISAGGGAATRAFRSSEPLTLNVVSHPSTPFWGMALELEVPGSNAGPQQVLIDTGSSAIALCDSSLAKNLTHATYPQNIVVPVEPIPEYVGLPMLQGNSYGGTGADEWYWGYVYVSNLSIASQGVSERVMVNVTFAVMEKQANMTCDLGFGGIFGVAFQYAGTQVWVQLNSSATPDQVLCAEDEDGAPSGVCDGYKHDDFSDDTYPAPAVWTALGEANSTKFGMYLYADGTNWTNLLSDSGTHYGQATAYIGSAADENSHYRASSPMTVPATQSVDIGNGTGLVSYGYWNMPMTAIHVKGSGYSGTAEFIAGQNIPNCSGLCFIDSGTPSIVMPQIVLEAAHAALAADENATVEVVLQQPPDPEQHVLSFPARDLAELYKRNMVMTSEEDGNVLVLGFGTWLYYYVVFDYGSPGTLVPGEQGNTTVTFVKKP